MHVRAAQQSTTTSRSTTSSSAAPASPTPIPPRPVLSLVDPVPAVDRSERVEGRRSARTSATAHGDLAGLQLHVSARTGEVVRAAPVDLVSPNRRSVTCDAPGQGGDAGGDRGGVEDEDLVDRHDAAVASSASVDAPSRIRRLVRLVEPDDEGEQAASGAPRRRPAGPCRDRVERAGVADPRVP